jgi:hyperosmotically inducible protein
MQILSTTALAVLLGTSFAARAQEPTTPPAQEQTDQTTKPDNSKTNKRDRQAQEQTADNQKNNPSDRDLTKNIRHALMKDKTLSMYAHNVKIISDHGTVTLKGPVQTDEEKQAIESKAKEIAGADNVKSEISVMPKSGASN